MGSYAKNIHMVPAALQDGCTWEFELRKSGAYPEARKRAKVFVLVMLMENKCCKDMN